MIVAPDTGYERLTPDLAERVDQACDWFEREWKTGPRPAIENHLDHLADSDRLVLVRELILVEIAYRRGEGESPQPEEYMARFPALEEPWLLQALAVPSGERLTATAAGRSSPKRAVAIPGYEILGELGRGGMGVVYKARQINLNRTVALKMFHPGAGDDERQRFRGEALAVARLKHPNIVQIHEVEEHEGRPVLVLEFVEGGNLDHRLAGKPLPARTAAELALTLARTIHFAHEKGIIHRDLKPANVLLAACDLASGMATDAKPQAAKITDFGLAKELDQSTHTVTGAVLGTPNYMAPEQAEGRTRDVGPAADVYALGAVLYECLTGRPPFQGESPLDTLDQVRRFDPISVRRLQPGVPLDLNTICLKCLRKDPRQRYPSAADLAEDLDRFLNGRPINARPTSTLEHVSRWCRRNPVVAGLLAGLVLVLTGGLIGVLAMWREAVNEASQKTLALNEARTNLADAQTNFYMHGVNLAYREWLANRIGQAKQQLDACPVEPRGWEWYYLRRLIDSEPLTLKGTTKVVSGLAFSPNGDLLATAHADGKVKTWEVKSGQPRLTLTVAGPVRSVAFSPNGRILAVTVGALDGPGVVKLWDATTGGELLALNDLSQSVSGLSFSSDNRRLAVADGPTVKVRDTATGQIELTLRPNVTTVVGVAFSPDGRRLATGSMARAKTGSPIGQVDLWDAASGANLRTFPFLSRGCHAVAFSRDGRHLGARGMGTNKVWNIANDVDELAVPSRGPFVFSADSQRLIVPDASHALAVWGLTSGLEEYRYRGHNAAVTVLATSSDGRWLASADDLGTVMIWDATSPQDARTYRRNFYAVSLAFSPDGRQLIGSGRREAGRGPVQMWDAATGKEPRLFLEIVNEVHAMALRPDGRTLVTVGGSADKGEVTVWDMASGHKLLDLIGHTRLVRAVAFSPDGERIATCGNDRTVKVWNGTTGQLVHDLSGSARESHCVTFSPDGLHLASIGEDGATVQIWDAATGQPLTKLVTAQGRVNHLVFSPDSRRLATSSSDARSVKVWDVNTGEICLTLPEPARAVAGMVYTPDGRRLIAAVGGLLIIWDATTGREVLTLDCHTDQVVALTISQDGRRVAACGTDRTIQVWESDPL